VISSIESVVRAAGTSERGQGDNNDSYSQLSRSMDKLDTSRGRGGGGGMWGSEMKEEKERGVSLTTVLYPCRHRASPSDQI